MATESPEYETLKYHAANIQLELQDNLDRFSIVLVSKGLITPEQSNELRNRHHPETKRAADLVSYILKKVRHNIDCFHIFTGALKDESPFYNAILKKLEKTLEDFCDQQGDVIGIMYINFIKIAAYYLSWVTFCMSQV